VDIVKGQGCDLMGVTVLVDRSEGKVDFGVNLISLIEMSFPSYDPKKLPPDLEAIPPVKPGS